MRNKLYSLLLIFLALFSYNFTVSNQNNLIGDLDKKYISEVVMIAMIAYQNSLLNENKSLSNNEIKSKNEFTLKFYKRSDWSTEELNYFLSTDWKITRDEIFIPLVTVTGLENYTFDKLLQYKFEEAKSDFFNSKIDSKKEEYRKISTELIPNQQVVNIDDSVSKDNKLIRLTDIFSWLLVCLGFLIIFYILLNFSVVKNFIRDKLARNHNHNKNPIRDNLVVENKQYHEENPNVENINKTIVEPTKEINPRLPIPEVTNEERLIVDNSTTNDDLGRNNQPDAYYFSGFQGDSFIKSYAKYKQDYSTIYIIRPQGFSGRGTLELITKGSTNIIANRDIYMPDSICEVKFEIGGSRSELIAKMGIVKDVGDKWQVEEKVKVTIK